MDRMSFVLDPRSRATEWSVVWGWHNMYKQRWRAKNWRRIHGRVKKISRTRSMIPQARSGKRPSQIVIRFIFCRVGAIDMLAGLSPSFGNGENRRRPNLEGRMNVLNKCRKSGREETRKGNGSWVLYWWWPCAGASSACWKVDDASTSFRCKPNNNQLLKELPHIHQPGQSH